MLVGFSGTEALGGVLLHPSSELYTNVDRINAVISVLAADINGAASATDPSKMGVDNFLRLQMDYTGFINRWKMWKEPLTRFFVPDGWLLNSKDQIDQFKSEYKSFRNRFMSLGGNPTGDLPEDLNAVTSTINAVTTLLAIGVVGYLAIQFLPQLPKKRKR